jgi:hypothetical protein
LSSFTLLLVSHLPFLLFLVFVLFLIFYHITSFLLLSILTCAKDIKGVMDIKRKRIRRKCFEGVTKINHDATIKV